MGARVLRPVDASALEVVVTADLVGRRRLVGHWIAEDTLLPAQQGPLVSYRAAHHVGTGLARPVDAAVLEMVIATDASGVVRSSVNG